jgi:RNA polymerase sigma-70 factor, ECF subfamily
MARKSLETTDMIESTDDFEAVYQAHAQSIYRFLFWRTRDNELSEDLTSNVFEKAWRARSSFHGGSVKAWLYRIARNTLTDHWRKKRELFIADTDELDASATDDHLDEALDQAAAVQELQKALAKLPDDMRAVVTLRFISGMPCKAVAEQLRLSESNVRVIQYRALRKLRGYLQ